MSVVVLFYDGNTRVWRASYVNREVADRAIERAAEVLGWIGIVISESKQPEHAAHSLHA